MGPDFLSSHKDAKPQKNPDYAVQVIDYLLGFGSGVIVTLQVLLYLGYVRF